MRHPWALRSCAVTLLLAGCAGDQPAAAPPDLDTSALPACAAQPSPPALPAVPGMTLPEQATVFSVYDVGALKQAQGIVTMTPIQVRSFYEQHDDLEVISVEDERVEAEILVSDGTHRMFVKAQIACATASNFTATVGSEAQAGALPKPAGSPQPPAG